MRCAVNIVLAISAFVPFLALARTPASAEPDKETLPRPVVETHDLMKLFNKPLYQLLKDEMQRTDDKKNWNTISERGLQAAEVANLVALRKDGGKDHRQWQQMAADLQSAGLRLSEAARSEDAEQTRQAYQTLITSCNACHQATAPDHAPQLDP